MSIREVRFAITGFFEALYYSVRTNEEWYEVRYKGWKVYHEITQPVRAVYYVFWRMWKYRSILWNDFDWDQGFLLELLEVKFLNMMKYHRDHGHTQDGYIQMHELRECAEICRRLRDDDYVSELDDAHEEIFGKLQTEFVPLIEEYGTNKLGKPRMYRWDAERPGANTPELRELERAAKHWIWNLEEQRKQSDLDRLGYLISKKMLTWWD